MSNTGNKLKITKTDLEAAGTVAGVTPDQTNKIWDELAKHAESGFSVASAAAYIGVALLIAGATVLLAKLVDDKGFGGALAISLVLTASFAIAAARTKLVNGMRVLSGSLFWLTAAMTPVTVWIIEEMFAKDRNYDKGMLIMTCVTVVVGLAITAWSRISFTVSVAFIAGLVSALTIGDMIGSHGFWLFGDSNQNATMSIYGAGLCALTFFIDKGPSADEDYAFWGYLIGAASLFAGLTFMDKGSLAWAAYAFGGVVTLLIGIVLGRVSIGFVGGAAIVAYAWYFLEDLLHADPVSAALLILVFGGAVVFGSFWYRKNQEKVENAVLALVPDSIKKILPPR